MPVRVIQSVVVPLTGYTVSDGLVLLFDCLVYNFDTRHLKDVIEALKSRRVGEVQVVDIRHLKPHDDASAR